MKKQQKIWMQNTSLAAFGGLILTALVCYAFITGRSLLNADELSFSLALFWLINFAFIGAIGFGVSVRFSDGSLTLPQMVWAICSTLTFMTLSRAPDDPYYLLLLLVMMFGVFRLKPVQFIGFAIFTSTMLGLQKVFLVEIGEENGDVLDLVFNWFSFTLGLIILTSLCRSVSILRSRLRKRNQGLQEALEVKNMFLANMSHELRTPINGIAGMLKLMENTPLNSEQQRYLHLIHSSSGSLLSTVSAILDFSKIDAGKLEIEEVDFDITQLVCDVAETVEQVAHKKGVEVVLDIADIEHSYVKSDPVRLRQILGNLTSNALKFTKEGEIRIQAKTEVLQDDQIQFSCAVADTGIGIPKHKTDIIFESFAQADVSTTREFGGTGLGLSIVKNLCDLMGGGISVKSDEGKGASFEFHLRMLALPQPFQFTDGRIVDVIAGKTVLIVDPSASYANAMTKQLAHWGVEVFIAKDAQGAIEQLNISESPQFFAVFVDANFDGDAGIEVCRTIRTRLNKTSLGLVLMHPLGETLQHAALADLKIRYVLSKPITPANLLDAFKALLNPLQAPGPPSDTKAETAKIETESHSENLQFNVNESASNDSALINSESPNKVLLVEDNEINQEVAAGILEMLDLEADVADNGQIALDMLNSAASPGYAAIFMDCQMPVMDGYEATRRIRKGEGGADHKDRPIIAMTANAMKGDREKCLASGMSDYVTKPIDVDLLEEKVLQWLGAKPQHMAKQIESEQTKETHAVVDESVWDMSAALRRALGGHDRLRAVIQLYLDSTPQIFVKMDKAHSEARVADLQKLAHEIKGVAGNIGANRLMLAMARLELACRENETFKMSALCREGVDQHNALTSIFNDYLQEAPVPK